MKPVAPSISLRKLMATSCMRFVRNRMMGCVIWPMPLPSNTLWASIRSKMRPRQKSMEKSRLFSVRSSPCPSMSKPNKKFSTSSSTSYPKNVRTISSKSTVNYNSKRSPNVKGKSKTEPPQSFSLSGTSRASLPSKEASKAILVPLPETISKSSGLKWISMTQLLPIISSTCRQRFSVRRLRRSHLFTLRFLLKNWSEKCSGKTLLMK